MEDESMISSSSFHSYSKVQKRLLFTLKRHRPQRMTLYIKINITK